MSEASIPPQLLAARSKIDEIDRKLILNLAERFALTQQVGKLKASKNLEAVDPDREANKLKVIRKMCDEHNLNPDLVANIFSQIMAEVVKNHRRLSKVE